MKSTYKEFNRVYMHKIPGKNIFYKHLNLNNNDDIHY